MKSNGTNQLEHISTTADIRLDT